MAHNITCGDFVRSCILPQTNFFNASMQEIVDRSKDEEKNGVGMHFFAALKATAAVALAFFKIPSHLILAVEYSLTSLVCQGKIKEQCLTLATTSFGHVFFSMAFAVAGIPFILAIAVAPKTVAEFALGDLIAPNEPQAEAPVVILENQAIEAPVVQPPKEVVILEEVLEEQAEENEEDRALVRNGPRPMNVLLAELNRQRKAHVPAEQAQPNNQPRRPRRFQAVQNN